jgi:hypothetical protein
MSTIWIAVGPNCWGKGFSRDQAVAACRTHWPTRAGRFHPKHLTLIETTDPWAYVDEMGGLVRAADATVTTHQEAQ